MFSIDFLFPQELEIAKSGIASTGSNNVVIDDVSMNFIDETKV